jgi:hypothetical protein
LSAGVTIAVAILALLCAAILLFDLVRGARRRAAIGLLLLVIFLVILNVTTGFPIVSSRISFGGSIPGWWALVAMAIGVVFGMVAQYVWTKPAKPNFLDFLRPIVVSPLVMLPLIGSLQDGPLETLQLASLTLLAFQNGFFWQQVLKDAKPAQA